MNCKLIWRYKRIPLPLRASMWFVVANVIHKGISLLTTPVFTRLLTVDQYGIYSVYQSWYSILIIVFTLNLHAGYFNNRLIHDFNEKDRISSEILGLSNAVTIFFFLIYLSARNFWNSILGLSTFFVVFIFLEAFFTPAYNLWMGVQRFAFRYRKMVAVSLFIAAVSPILGIAAVLFTEHKVEARISALASVQVFVGIIFYFQIMLRGKRIFSKKHWLKGLNFNLPLIPHWLSMTILGSSDRIMIQKLIGNGEAAIYGVAYTVSTMINLAINGINQALTPYTYGKLKEKKYSNIKNNSTFLMTLVFGGCIMAMLFGPELIKFFAAPAYFDARWIIPPVAGSVFFSFQYNLFSIVEFYHAKTKIIMVESCAAAILNIVLNCLAIPIFGYIAAAYTTLISYVFLALLHALMSCKILRSKGISASSVYHLKLAAALSVLMCVTLMSILPIYDYIFIRYGIISVFLLVMIWKRRLILTKLREMKSQ